jgi:hypothetical protein
VRVRAGRRRHELRPPARDRGFGAARYRRARVARAVHSWKGHRIMTTIISVINESTVCTADEIAAYVPDLQTQVTRDFAPVWGADAQLTFVAKGSKPDPKSWQLVVLDNSDQAGALGYHDLTAKGRPLSKIFAASDLQYQQSVSVTMSHELLEMLGDPGINLTAQGPDPANPDDSSAVAFYMYEACDACEADEYGYKVNDTLVSDFVYPDWFGGAAGTQFDHKKHVKSPFQILDGGYIGVWTPTKGWTQYTGQKAHGARHASRASVGSRRERRTVGHARWALSSAWA